MDTVTLDMPATTRDGLRAQAAQLDIAGRGAMNKAQLQAAVSAEITRRVALSIVAGTDDTVSVEPTDDGYQVTVPATTHGPVVELSDFPYVAHAPVEQAPASLVYTSHGRVLTTRDVARVESCGLAPGESITAIRPMESTRVKGHKGTGILRTRAGRVDYPASKRARKGGRK